MKNIRIAINGFGRIGRALFRVLHNREGVEVVAINDIANAATLAHLLKYDSVHRTFDAQVSHSANTLVVDGISIPMYNKPNLDDLIWDCDVLVEASGQYLLKEELEKHISAGAKKVLLTAPPANDDVKMLVLGVNDHILSDSDLIISNASCTTNCAAPMVELINDNFGVEQAYITTVHSYTKDQSLHDSPHKDLRRARAGAQSIIPTTTGAAKALSRIFPTLEIGGCGMRVPVPNGSLTDITFVVKENCNIEQINKVFYEASLNSHKGIVAYTKDPIVSVDVIGQPASCLFDSQLTSVLGKMVKIVAWYDNEMGYSNRLVDMIKRMS